MNNTHDELVEYVIIWENVHSGKEDTYTECHYS